MVLRRGGLLAKGSLVAGAGWSAVLFSLGPPEGFHPLAVMASLLPLQVAALVWVSRSPAGRGADAEH